MVRIRKNIPTYSAACPSGHSAGTKLARERLFLRRFYHLEIHVFVLSHAFLNYVVVVQFLIRWLPWPKCHYVVVIKKRLSNEGHKSGYRFLLNFILRGILIFFI